MYNQQILAYTIIGICFILGIIIICWNRQRERNQEFQSKMRAEFQQKLDNEFNVQLHKLEAQRSQISINNQTISGINARISDLDREMNEKIAMNKSLKLAREEELNDFIAIKKDAEEARIQKELDDWACSSQEAQEFMQDERLALLDQEYNIRKDTCQSELDHIQAELEDYRKKRNTINEDILRARQVAEHKDFYSIQIDSDTLHDINILSAMRDRLYKEVGLDQIIYNVYIAKPVREMTKRVLGGKDPSGIYKVTSLSTGEIYIGKSTTVASRWINHCKSAYGLEGVADSQFQRALKKQGIFMFTWELLEEVPKDQLTEREKYWIDFYDTTKYGFNMRKG